MREIRSPLDGIASPLGARRGFSPGQLAGLVAWYDPSDLASLFQDVAMTMPVTSAGQSVAVMCDKSGNARHMLQAVAAARPVYGYEPVTGRRNLLTNSEDFNFTWQKQKYISLQPKIVQFSGEFNGFAKQAIQMPPSTIFTFSGRVRAIAGSPVYPGGPDVSMEIYGGVSASVKKHLAQELIGGSWVEFSLTTSTTARVRTH